MNYWNRADELKKKAQAHTAEMDRKYAINIRGCIEQSTIYGGPDKTPESSTEADRRSKQYTLKATTDEALFRLRDDFCGKVAILNFASYNNPGGKFTEGSSAQEESCCHVSFLYNVLRSFAPYYDWNNAHKNKALYENRAIYSPGIVFLDKDENEHLADVITCAAPNRSVLEKYGSFSEEENLRVLENRVNFVRDICVEQKVNTVILGAWGCGVFRQDPETVARSFKEAFRFTNMNVIYAIPDEKTLKAFDTVINKK